MEIPLSVQLGLVVSKHMVLCNTLTKQQIKNQKINLNKNYKIKKPKIDSSILE